MKYGISIVAGPKSSAALGAAIRQNRDFHLVSATESYDAARHLICRKCPKCLILEIAYPIRKVQILIGEIHRRNLSLRYLVFGWMDEHTIVYTHSDIFSDECVTAMADLFHGAMEPMAQCVNIFENDPFWNYWFQIPPDYAMRRYILTEILRGMSNQRFRQYQKNYYLDLKGRGYYLFIYEQMERTHFDHKENRNCFNFIGEYMNREFRQVLNKYNGGEVHNPSPIRLVVIANDFETRSVSEKKKMLGSLTGELLGATRRISGFSFISPLIGSIDEISEVYQAFEKNKINHFFYSDKQPMTVAELERKGEFDDYDKIQEILRKFKNAITYDSDPRHAVSLIRTLFLEHVKSSCDINLFFYCISVIKNNLISHYSGADIANRFTDFSVNDFLFSSIEEQCEKLCGILVDLSSQYVNPSSMNHPSIYQAISYIRENYSEDLTVARIAEKVHMNSVYFGRLFKNKTGFTVNQYLMRCRIHAAMRCLKSTSKSVSEISQMVGFRDLQYFSNTFRRQTGYSPLQYRSSQSPQASLAFVDEEG